MWTKVSICFISKFYKLVIFTNTGNINYALCLQNVVLSKTKADLKMLFFEFVKVVWRFKMATRLEKRTKTRREVIKILFNVEKTKENRYRKPQKGSVYQLSVPYEHFRPS